MLQKEQLDSIFKQVGDTIKEEAEITLCGGTGIMLSIGSREATHDIDYLQATPEAIYEISEIFRKAGSKIDVINNNACATSSYSPRLIMYRALYNVFGSLYVYTLQPIAALCMKLKAFRAGSFDKDDIASLCKKLRAERKDISYVYHTLSIIYTDATISVEAEKFLQEQFETNEFYLDNESVNSYIDAMQSGLMTEADLPTEFKAQIMSAYNKMNTDKLLFAANLLGGSN